MGVRFYKDSNIVTSLVVVVGWLTDISISQHFQTLTTEGNKSHTRATRVNLLGSLLAAVFDFSFLKACPEDPATHLVPSNWPRALTPRVQDQRRPWHACNENTAYFSVCLWCTLSKTFLLLSSPDQRLLLFLLLLLILFSTLIAQSSLTMTLMLMWRWRGCFNELQCRSEGLRGVRERE